MQQHEFSIEGTLSDEELAALTAVLNQVMNEAATASAETQMSLDRSADRSRALGIHERPSRNAWRASTRGRYVA